MTTWTKPRIEDARLICSCQHAGGSHASAHRRASDSRRRAGWALLLSLPLAVASLGFGRFDSGRLLSSSPSLAGAAPVDSRLSDPAASLRAIEKAREEFFTSQVPYGALIYREALSNGLEPELIAAIIRAESDFQPKLVSERSATGLMQLLPSTAGEMGFGDISNPAANVAAGAKYLKYLQAEFNGDEILALAAYNAGEGSVRRFEGIPPYRETRDYVRKVGRFRYEYRQMVLRHAAGFAPVETAGLER